MEEFFTLKEIMSLDTKIGQHRHTIQEEQKRIERLDLMKQTRDRELARYNEQEQMLTRDLQAVEKVLAQAQQRIEFLATQENQITTGPALLAWEHECKDVKTKIETAENQTFQLMMELEKIEVAKKDIERFLHGFKQSYEEITNEVVGINQVETESINQLQIRKTNLVSLLPQSMQRSYQKAFAKHPHDLAFTWENSGECTQCFYQLSSLDRQKIESGELIDNCKGCGRIFLPLKVVKNQA